MYAMAAVDWNKLYSAENLMPAIRIAALLLVGFPLVYSVSSFIGRSTKRKLSPQANMLLRKGLFYTGATILLLAILYQLGFKLTALLGAAGIVGIAIGFASQTSVSNIISGIFLISERPFSVGDQIQVGTTKGIILSIELLSVKLRTFENQLVRIPNESLIKERFDAKGIEIPFPHRSLYAGSMTAPMPIRIVSEPPDKQTAEQGND